MALVFPVFLGLRPVPGFGVAGGGAAVVLSTASTLGVLGWHLLSGRNLAKLRRLPLRWHFA